MTRYYRRIGDGSKHLGPELHCHKTHGTRVSKIEARSHARAPQTEMTSPGDNMLAAVTIADATPLRNEIAPELWEIVCMKLALCEMPATPNPLLSPQ